MNVNLRKPSPRRVPPALCTHSSAWRRVIIPAAPLGESLLQRASRPRGHCTSSRVSPGGHLALGSRVFSRLRAAHPFLLRLPFSGILEMSPGLEKGPKAEGGKGHAATPPPTHTQPPLPTRQGPETVNVGVVGVWGKYQVSGRFWLARRCATWGEDGDSETTGTHQTLGSCGDTDVGGRGLGTLSLCRGRRVPKEQGLTWRPRPPTSAPRQCPAWSSGAESVCGIHGFLGCDSGSGEETARCL